MEINTTYLSEDLVASIQVLNAWSHRCLRSQADVAPYRHADAHGFAILNHLNNRVFAFYCSGQEYKVKESKIKDFDYRTSQFSPQPVCTTFSTQAQLVDYLVERTYHANSHVSR